VDLGITDPDLFILIPLLEEGVGPDLISNLTTNVIAAELGALTEVICKTLGIPTNSYSASFTIIRVGLDSAKEGHP
jgi:hypothetical protein